MGKDLEATQGDATKRPGNRTAALAGSKVQTQQNLTLFVLATSISLFGNVIGTGTLQSDSAKVDICLHGEA